MNAEPRPPDSSSPVGAMWRHVVGGLGSAVFAWAPEAADDPGRPLTLQIHRRARLSLTAAEARELAEALLAAAAWSPAAFDPTQLADKETP